MLLRCKQSSTPPNTDKFLVRTRFGVRPNESGLAAWN